MLVEEFRGKSDEWDEYVLGNDKRSIYNLYTWGMFFRNVYSLNPLYLCVRSNGKIVGIMLLVLMKNYKLKKLLVSLPYFCTSGILSDNVDAESLLVKKAKELMKKYKCAHTLIKFEKISSNLNYSKVDNKKKSFVLSLNSNSDEVFSSFDKQIRRRIRKGYKSGCTIDISKKYIDEFYNIYRINMRTLGTPVHKKNFYSMILDHFPDNYTVLVVLLGDKIIGAQLLSFFADTVYLPLASSLREYNNYSPNHLLYWESIKYGCENGYSFCDFGRSTIDSGPYNFKKQWNAEEVPLEYCYLYLKPYEENIDSSYSKLEVISEFWKKLPLPVTNFVGPYFAKWLP